MGRLGEGLAVEGQRRAGDGDPGDEGGEDTDSQDRQDHWAVSPDHLPGTESFDSVGQVTPPVGVRRTIISTSDRRRSHVFPDPDSGRAAGI